MFEVGDVVVVNYAKSQKICKIVKICHGFADLKYIDSDKEIPVFFNLNSLEYHKPYYRLKKLKKIINDVRSG